LAGLVGHRDYKLAFLGDDVAGESGEGAVVPQAVLVILFLALMLPYGARCGPPRRGASRNALPPPLTPMS